MGLLFLSKQDTSLLFPLKVLFLGIVFLPW